MIYPEGFIMYQFGCGPKMANISGWMMYAWMIEPDSTVSLIDDGARLFLEGSSLFFS